MIQLNPSQIYPLIYKISDPLDASTYYVRAVVKNARTLATLTTINLTDNGSQLFSNNYQVPADTSGQGFFINIEITVYTDSGYTTKSPNYQIDNKTFLVQERFNPVVFGAGGSSVDYKKIREMIEEAAPKPVIVKGEKATDRTGEVLAAVDKMTKNFREISAGMAEHKAMIAEQMQGMASDFNERLLAVSQTLAQIDQHTLPNENMKSVLETQTAIMELETRMEQSLEAMRVSVEKMRHASLDARLEQFVKGFIAMFTEFRTQVMNEINDRLLEIEQNLSDKRYVQPVTSKQDSQLHNLARELAP